jgi:L-threonylcarbamoyladenylate synthase
MQLQMDKAVTLLTNGELVVIPTETVYGLAANALNEKAVQKIFTLKNRPATNPLICHVPSIEKMLPFIDKNSAHEIVPLLEKLKPFWPGSLTVVVPKSFLIPDIISAGHQSVALRIPNHPVTLELLNKIPFPLAAPSANRSNYISPTTSDHVRKEFSDDTPYILEGGTCNVGIESTVLSLLNAKKPIILRPGAITKNQIEGALGIPIETTIQNSVQHVAQISPGQGSIHYAPRTKLKLLSGFDFGANYYERIGLIAFSADKGCEHDFAAIEILSENRNERMIAARLYEALRSLDQMQLDIILIDECEPVGIGAAIMDRINRALTK